MEVISTHTPLAGRDFIAIGISMYREISTHTPLAGRDLSFRRRLSAYQYFYSHAPRGARPPAMQPYILTVHFYSHAPRGARLACGSRKL